MIVLFAALALAEPTGDAPTPVPSEAVTPEAEAPSPGIVETGLPDAPEPATDTAEAEPQPAEPEPAPDTAQAEPQPSAPQPAEPEPPPAAPEPTPAEPEPAPPPRPAAPMLTYGPPWSEPQPAEPEPSQPAHEDPASPASHDDPAHDEPAHPALDQAPPDHEPPASAPPPVDELPDAPHRPIGTDLLLAPPTQSRGRVFAFLAIMAVSVVASTVARRTRSQLREGVISSLLRVADTAGRVLMVLAGLGLVTQLVPSPLLPVLPWAVLGSALAIGWSLRDALPDLVAWTQISAEGSVRRGQWVRGEGYTGRVERIGLRATWLSDDRGQRVAVPNRLLVHGTVRTDKDCWYVAEVDLHLPDVAPAAARRAIERACMLSPWVAPGAGVDVRWDPSQPARWSLRVQLLEGGFADAFRGAIRERVEELLGLP